jgi:glycosyltransferase involved in cell wall biosynthesis
MITPDYINFKILFRSDDKIGFFISTWIHNKLLFEKVYHLLSQLKVRYKRLYAFIIPWWHKDGLQHYELLSKFCCTTMLANSMNDNIFYKKSGLNSIYCNQNCWLDSNTYCINDTEKKYDLVINANNYQWKNHKLLANINKKYKTLFITYNTTENDLNQYNPCNIFNEVTNDHVATGLNQSKIGLALSTIEGSCYASTEYLLCGLPVISTKSVGGRHIWYNENNSIIIDNSESELEAAIRTMLSNIDKFNRQIIRTKCIEQQNNFRNIFIKYAQKLLPTLDIKNIVNLEYSNKMLYHTKIENLTLDYIMNYEICSTAK